ncbi:MAG: 30S ribosomal protein THX [Fluviicola sp. XM-24bin1]|nr:MAG: 30S ribosomal protein THX [Fluviicola sp. XM-24bin1]
MGKGDRRTTKGKRILGTYGNTRKRKKSTPTVAEAKPKKKAAPKKAAPKKAAAEDKPAAKKTTAKKAPAKKAKEKTEE